MLYLVLCIACSVIVSVLLKIARRQAVVLEQAIALNYVMAITLTVFLLKPTIPDDLTTLSWGVFLALGVLLPSIFVVMGRAVEYAGIAKSDAAQRLSLILPIIASVTIFGQSITTVRIVGVVLAFVALFCLLAKSDTAFGMKSDRTASDSVANTANGGLSGALLLLGVWLGYGVIDILFKQLAKSGSSLPLNLLIAFSLACLLMVLYTLFRGKKWSMNSIIGGLILGVFNFFNIWFYIKSHQTFSNNPTLVFAAVNIGVIALGTLIGALVFKEKLRLINVIGLVIAIAAILTLFYGQDFINRVLAVI